MGGELPNSPIIIRVESNEARLNIGEEIAVRMRNGYLFFQDMNANMNFVNFMQAGDEYLLFLEHKFDFPDPKEDNLYFFSDLIIPGIFNYQDQDHIVIDVPVDDR